MLASIKRAFHQDSSPGARAPATAALHFADNAPSWAELEVLAGRRAAELGDVRYPWEDLDSDASNSYALRRTFGQPGKPRIKLYRDHAAWCPYCHKVVLQLEEKRIPYVIEKVNMRCYGDKPPEFMAKVPNGLLPVLEVDGQVITESAIIQQVSKYAACPQRVERVWKATQQVVLEELYPQRPLLPPEGTTERARATALMRLERRLFSAWLGWLCQGWGHEQNKAAFTVTMDAVEAELGKAEGPYFLSDFSLVDCTFAPFLERIQASLLYYKGFACRGEGRWPNLERWFAAMEGRPAYLGFKSDAYTHCHDLPPQLGGCVMHPDGEPFAAAIDGRDPSSWRLPLEPLGAGGLEPHIPGSDPQVDALLAGARIVQNRERVVPFALRGVGSPGTRPVSAPLSDPTAVPGMQHEAEADAVLRHVAHALLLGGPEDKQARVEAALTPVAAPSAGLPGGAAVLSLAHLRDHVCVPRDLPLPAARTLRAYCNWAIDVLTGGGSRAV